MIPCQCEHNHCVHPHGSVPAGDTMCTWIGPICDACIPHLKDYILTGEDAANIKKEVEAMINATP